MLFLLKVQIPVEAGNAAARQGKLGPIIQSILAEQKPEAAYFTEDHGKRCGYLFVEMKDTAEIPKFAEPWFLALNAALEFHATMRPADLEKAGPAIEAAVKKYG